ncbi:hypothetical protein [Shewanella sp. NIFS-20-20]|uniref:hypothetical protein n=1 Tax=Shewanella sp. NIFS-20-20 TaxID=2853806 RepID=UPI001C48E4BA|nr:hypothetical protein [Shewanella sp. NIFS-20-20]MBV7317173.1 hypothetical protein [Shewanella sp. NIFS-20-20]
MIYRQAYIQGLTLADDAPLIVYLRRQGWQVQACEHWPQTGLLILGIAAASLPVAAITAKMSLLTPYIEVNSHLLSNHSFLVVTSGATPQLCGVNPLSIQALEWPTLESKSLLMLESWLMAHFGEVEQVDEPRLVQLKQVMACQVSRQWQWRDHLGQTQQHVGRLTRIFRQHSQHFVSIDDQFDVPIKQLIVKE